MAKPASKIVSDYTLLIVIAFLAVLWLQAPRLIDDFQVDGDFRSFYRMNQFQDQELFPDLPALMTIELLGLELPFMEQSPGYGFLFYIASFFISPVLFSKIIAFIILPITALYLFEFGRIINSRFVGIALALAFIFLSLASPSSTSIIPGLQRSFALTLIVILIYYLHRQKYVGAALAIIGSVLIYPPMFVLGVVTWGLYLISMEGYSLLKQLASHRGFWSLVAATLLSFIIMMPLMIPLLTSTFADKTVNQSDVTSSSDEGVAESYDYIWNNPTYRAGGQYPLFFLFPFVGRGGLVNNGEDAVHLLILFCLSCLIALARGRRAFDIPQVMWSLLWASFVLFVLSWLVIALTSSFLLYLPSRYTRVGLFLFLLVFVVWNARDTVTEAIDAIQRNPKILRGLIGVVAVLVVGLVIFYPSQWSTIGGFNMKWLLTPVGILFGILAITVIRRPTASLSTRPQLNRLPGSRGLMIVTMALFLVGWAFYAPLVSNVDFLDPSPAERELLQFLETLPKDVMLAGTPVALDNVPLFASRQVLFNADLGGLDGDGIRRALNTYYADDPQIVLDFCQQYDVDYLVIDQTVYTENYLAAEKIFFEPYHQELYPEIIKRASFVLPQIPIDKAVFASNPYRVIKCDAETLLANN